MMLPISCYIIAKNEADRIATPILSVKNWVNEVVVVDSESTDSTRSVAEALGAHVITNPWPGYGFQKRFAEEQCKNKWLLCIDADEEITPELKTEIHALFASGEPTHSGYIIRIRDLLPGEQKLAIGAHTDFRLRLYNKEKSRTEASAIYDPVIIESGTTATLNAPMLHRSVRSLSHAIEKINHFSNVQAKNMKNAASAPQMLFPWLRLLLEFPFAFFKSYVLRGYILRGGRGFIYSVVYAFGRFLRIAKYLELRK